MTGSSVEDRGGGRTRGWIHVQIAGRGTGGSVYHRGGGCTRGQVHVHIVGQEAVRSIREELERQAHSRTQLSSMSGDFACSFFVCPEGPEVESVFPGDVRP